MINIETIHGYPVLVGPSTFKAFEMALRDYVYRQ